MLRSGRDPGSEVREPSSEQIFRRDVREGERRGKKQLFRGQLTNLPGNTLSQLAGQHCRAIFTGSEPVAPGTHHVATRPRSRVAPIQVSSEGKKVDLLFRH